LKEEAFSEGGAALRVVFSKYTDAPRADLQNIICEREVVFESSALTQS
jgi:hypothetical protein